MKAARLARQRTRWRYRRMIISRKRQWQKRCVL